MKMIDGSAKMLKVLSVLDNEVGVTLDRKVAENEVRPMAIEKYVRHFPQVMDSVALSTQKLNHVYEIGHPGSPRHRLFKMVRKNRGISVVLRPAKLRTPLTSVQIEKGTRKTKRRLPGSSGKLKVTKRYVFYARPYLFEFGRPFKIKRKPGTLFMWKASGSKPMAIKGPVKIVPKKNRFMFRTATEQYFKIEGKMVMKDVASAYAKNSSKRISRAIRAAK